MPQDKKQGKESPAKQREALLKAITNTYTGEDTAHKLFRKAVELDVEKRGLLERIGANRRSLRDLASQGIVDKNDVDALYTPQTKTEAEADAPAAG